jgi:very-short-patch-repair endonuclease
MKDPYITTQTRKLSEALVKLGVHNTLEYYDGHKHIDIAILSSKIFIEVDGLHHFTDSKQIEADFKRNHFSDGDDFDTIHIPNIVIENHCDAIAKAIAELITKRLEKP